jgi:Cdc6-like AAA superfamily ATPase
LSDISIFETRSLVLVSKKVATISGDIRRSLQITKRAVEICRDEYQKGPTANLKKVSVDHVIKAYDEMSNSKTVQVLRGLRKLEVLVTISLFLELKSSKQSKVLMDRVQDRCETLLAKLMDCSLHERKQLEIGDDGEKLECKTFYYDTNWNKCIFSTTIYREIVKRLQAFGLINLIVENKITDNTHLTLFVYFDELRNAFESNEIYQS